MDILGTVKSLLGGGGHSEEGGSVAMLKNLIQSHGGLQGLLDKFQNAGLGETVKSWIGLGANKSLSADDVEHAIGTSTLDRIAATTGMDRTALANKLAEYLPKVVDKLTPTGQVPSDATVSQLLDGLQANAK